MIPTPRAGLALSFESYDRGLRWVLAPLAPKPSK